MSMCIGQVECEIYRDKRFCRKENAKGNHQICECRHAKRLCDVGYCVFEGECHSRKEGESDGCT